MALTVTPGGSSDDSYVSIATANSYFVGLRFSAWDAVVDATQENALKQATQEIERLGGATQRDLPTRALFPGLPYDTATPQALHFPRATDLDVDGNLIIPQNVENAVCEQAAFLLGLAGLGGVSSGSGGTGSAGAGDDGVIDHASMHRNSVSSFSMDGLSFSYRDSSADATCPRHISPDAWFFIKPYVRQTARLIG